MQCEYSNVEQDEQEVLEEYCSPYSADAATTAVEIDSDHQDVSSTNVQHTQWEVLEEPDCENGHSLQLTDIAPVPLVRSYGEITYSDTYLHDYPRQSHQPPQCYIDYDLH